MAAPPIRVRGGARLRRTLRKAGDDLSDLKELNQRLGALVAARAASLAPRRTGRLRASLRPAKRAGGVRVSAGGARLPYAGPIHWGWPARGIEAQPFITDAGQELDPVITTMYAAELEKIIDRVAGA